MYKSHHVANKHINSVATEQL